MPYDPLPVPMGTGSPVLARWTQDELIRIADQLRDLDSMAGDRLDRLRLIDTGFLYTFNFAPFDLNPGPYVIALKVPDDGVNVFMQQLRITSLDKPDDLQIDVFLGGTTSGGTAVAQVPVNATLIQPAPFASVQEDVTVDVAGTLFRSVAGDWIVLDGQAIVAPNTELYVSMSELLTPGTGPEHVQVIMYAARLEP